MLRVLARFCVTAALLSGLSAPVYAEGATTPRGLAFVIAQSEHPMLPSPLADQDAGYIATELAENAYAVTAARNLDASQLRSAIDDFKLIAKAQPELPVLVYLSGALLQSHQDNFLLGIDTSSFASEELKAKAVSIQSLMLELAQQTKGPKIFILDGARIPAKATSVPATSSGLAILKLPAHTSMIFNQSPGMFAKDSEAGYQPFALAIAEAIRYGATPRDFADFTLLRTFERSKGRQIPWATTQPDHDGKIFALNRQPLSLFKELRSKPMSSLDMTQGFAAAILKGSVITYEEYNLIHIQNPMTSIIRTVLAALRDAQIWREANTSPSASGYWAYLNLYPRGLHSAEAIAALKSLGQPAIPSASEPLLALTTTPPTHDELLLLAQINPYRLDESLPDLASVSEKIASILPLIADENLNPDSSHIAASRHDLPLPTRDDSLVAKIERPKSIAEIPLVAKLPDATPAKALKKTFVPVPPRRLPENTSITEQEEPALITITIPVPTSTPPAQSEAPAAKPQQSRPTTDVFEQSFSTPSAEQNLPY